MNKETVEILKSLGVYNTSKLTIPENIASLGLQLTIQRNGNSVIVFCNGGESEYQFLGNHGAFSVKHEMQTVCADTVPYLTLSPRKFARVLRSIALNRILIRAAMTGKRKLARLHQSLANSYVARWLAILPDETNRLYGRDMACNEVYTMAESL